MNKRTLSASATLCLLLLVIGIASQRTSPPEPIATTVPKWVAPAVEHTTPNAVVAVTTPAPMPSPSTAASGVAPLLTEPPAKDGARKEGDKIITEDGREFPLRIYKTALTPNDPLYNQWWVAPNNMTAVWDIPAGARTTKVAVIDTGFALNHQEFAGRWAINQGEAGPLSTNGLDDDDNGLVDDWRGWDFTAFDNSVQAGETNPSGTGTTHGTMVSGVLGATGNNGVGVAGVNWFTSILPIQALDDDDYGDSYTVGQSVYYAADQGADVINLSLGTSADDPYLRLAIRYAIDRGSVVVAASGNDGCDCISYPANYPEVVAVGAINPSGNPTTFSSYGAQLDLLAPGQSMTSAFWTPANQTSSYANNIAGTSFASPFTAGLLAYGRMLQPDAVWEEIIGTMLENSDRRTLTAGAPRSNTLGFGVARANTMLSRLTTPNTSAIRYQFGGGMLGSGRAYQCFGTIPGSFIYELSKNGVYRYTANLRELSKAVNSGWTSRHIGYTCIGLPTDDVDVLRIIDLPKEIRNVQSKN